MCAGAVFPTAIASAETGAVAQALIDQGVVREASFPTNPRDMYPDLPVTAIMVVTPGTDDVTLFPRVLPMVGQRQVLVVQYPESFWPAISGKSGAILPIFAPTYDQSKKVATDGNVRVMTAFAPDRANGPHVVYTGFSQGADALGDAVEQAYGQGIDLSNSRVILASDPRSPWGIKSWLAGTPLSGPASLVGITSNGARDPGDTGSVPITSVIIIGDPVTNFQWVPYRPVSSLLVNAAGFFTIHAGMGSQNYGTLDSLGTPTVLYSVDGATTYQVYDAVHPLAQVVELVYRDLGIPYTAADVARWDAEADAFYPLQQPGVDNAAVPVTTTPAPSVGGALPPDPIDIDSVQVTDPAPGQGDAQVIETDATVSAPGAAPQVTSAAPVDESVEAAGEQSAPDVSEGAAQSDSGAAGSEQGGNDQGGGDSESSDSDAADSSTDSESSSDSGSSGENGSSDSGGDSGSGDSDSGSSSSESD